VGISPEIRTREETGRFLKLMFDAVKGKFEKGPYFPKERTKNSWVTRSRDQFDSKLGSRLTTISHTLNLPEARIAIFGDSVGLAVEASLPKLLHGSNLMTVTYPEEALRRLDISLMSMSMAKFQILEKWIISAWIIATTFGLDLLSQITFTP
jgi:hypothetical protein